MHNGKQLWLICFDLGNIVVQGQCNSLRKRIMWG
ncbi:hypothetical protein PVAP13_6NG245703 [Panicum virgatum]|uniref:Uncharacterized protein n=1 Tax=Panicum virgatum TaxID=38727 RepID=A0A8T0R1U7_PANVG|nr:hypothetical protein PVAP13_6NG245703 [Panicum virgatum]